MFLEDVQVAEYQGDLLLLCQISNGEAGGGFIARLNGRTLKTRWKRELPGFNVGSALIEDDSAYTTAIGFVGKVNLRSGRFAWTHEGLYRDGNFTAFELPQSDNENVLFKETTIYSRPVKTIVVDKKNGRIVQIR